MQAHPQFHSHLKPPYTVSISLKHPCKITIRNKPHTIQLTITLNSITDLQFTTSHSTIFSLLSIRSKSYDAYGVLGIHTFHSLPFLIIITSITHVCSVDGNDIYKVTDIKCLPLQQVPSTATAIVDYYVENYRKSVINNYYFSYQYNVTKCGEKEDVYVANKEQLNNCKDGFNVNVSQVKGFEKGRMSSSSVAVTGNDEHMFMRASTSSETLTIKETMSNVLPRLTTANETFQMFFTYCICGYVNSIQMKILKQEITCVIIQRRSNKNSGNSNTNINITNYEVIVKCNNTTFSKEYFTFTSEHITDQQHIHTALTSAFAKANALTFINTFYKDTLHLQDNITCTLQSIFNDAHVLTCTFDAISSHYHNNNNMLNTKQHQIDMFRLNKQIEQTCITYKQLLQDSNNVLVVSSCKVNDDVPLKIIERVSYDMVIRCLNGNDVFSGKTSEIFGTLLSYVNVDESNYLYGVNEYESEDMSLVKGGFNSMAWNGSLFRGNNDDVIASSMKYEEDYKENGRKENIDNEGNEGVGNIRNGRNVNCKCKQTMGNGGNSSSNNKNAYDIYLHGERLNKSYDNIFAEIIQCNAQFKVGKHELTINSGSNTGNSSNNIIEHTLLTEHHYINTTNINLDTITTYIATWNVNAFDTTNPHNTNRLNLRELLFPHKHSFHMETPPDIIIISLQEIVELCTKNILLQDNNKPSITFWVNQLWECVGKDTYIKLHQNELVGIMLITFIKVNLFPYVKHCKSFTKKTGANGLFGNKGVCIHSFHLCERKFAFAGVHYACGVEKNIKRVDELRTTLDVVVGKDELFRKSDVWFICGDLNFRIDLDIERCVEHIKTRNITALGEFDQCRNVIKEMYNEEICEDVVKFMPTFKYVKGTNEYNLNKRVPSWCDRIVYKNIQAVTNVFYDVAHIYLSDHIPVVGLYKVNVGMLRRGDECI